MEQVSAFHCTTRGYSHILKDICCEDASGSYNCEAFHIAVVSDGHGDPACFRSHTGAQLAVDIAIEQLKSFADTLLQENWTERLLQPEEQEPLVRQLIRSIMGNWTIQILEDLDNHPITEEELLASGSYEASYRAGLELPHIYGCTLIAALITESYLLVLHQGDGRCVVIRNDGTVNQPVPWDSLCVGNICTSLCHEDAVERCRYYLTDLSEEPITACYVTTDGIEDSVESLDHLNAFFCKISRICSEKGAEAMPEYLEQLMPEISKTGSADDTSIAAIINTSALSGISDKMELIHRLSVCESAGRAAREKLRSMQRKMAYLQNQLQKAEEEWKKFEQQEEDNELSPLAILWDLIVPKDEHVQQDLKEKAMNAYQKAKEEHDAYFEKWSEYENTARSAEAQAEEIRSKLANSDRSSDFLEASPNVSADDDNLELELHPECESDFG